MITTNGSPHRLHTEPQPQTAPPAGQLTFGLLLLGSAVMVLLVIPAYVVLMTMVMSNMI